MNIQALKQSFEELQHLPFPKAVDIPGFTDWISDLAECDAFFAGLAVSRLEGGEGATLPLPSLSKLADDLKKLHGQNELPAALYEECERYLVALTKLAACIRALQA